MLLDKIIGRTIEKDRIRKIVDLFGNQRRNQTEHDEVFIVRTMEVAGSSDKVERGSTILRSGTESEEFLARCGLVVSFSDDLTEGICNFVVNFHQRRDRHTEDRVDCFACFIVDGIGGTVHVEAFCGDSDRRGHRSQIGMTLKGQSELKSPIVIIGKTTRGRPWTRGRRPRLSSLLLLRRAWEVTIWAHNL